MLKKKVGDNVMNILTRTIVSNSEMIKNYKACREKAEGFGKVFVLKNNKPDAVLFSIAEYERLSVFIEHFDNLEKKDIEKFIESLSRKGNKENFSTDNLKTDI